jgi:hypothetical protein
MHFSKQPPLDLSLVSKKRYPSVFFRSPPGPTHSGNPLLLYQHLPLHPNGKNSFSRLLCTLPVFVQYTLSLLNSSFFVLPSAFLGISKRTPYPTPTLPPPPMSDCVFTHACVRAVGVMVWYGSRQSGSNRLLTFFPLHPYYIICILLAIVCTSSSSRPFLV